MVEFILVDIRVELSELVVHISSIWVVLDLEVRVSKKGESSSVSGTEL
jgi:hypothetical protein